MGTHLVHLNPPSYLDCLLPPNRPSPTEGHEPVQVAAILVDPDARCAHSQLFAIAASLFFIDLLIPDLIPFIDEILLGLLTLLLGSMQNKPEAVQEAEKQVKDITPPDEE